MKNYKHILLCGGAGKRLWPLSRENYPKPYLSFNNEASLFQKTMQRHINADEHLIITNQRLFYQSNYQVNQISALNKVQYILESCGKNTGPAILLACLASNEDDTLVVTPADHDIEPIENYHNNIYTGIDLAEKTNGIVLIGIQPTYPSTEFGYIETKDQCVRSFKEKPDAMTAEAYLKSGHYLWNSGIFIFKASTVINAFKTIAPTTYKKVHHAYNTKSELNIVELDTIDAMSFDRGILEKSNNIHVINNTFGWSDMGCFDELEKRTPSNKKEVQFNASNTFSMSTSDKAIAFHDVSDVYLIESNDAILVGKKGSSKHVSDVVSTLEKTNAEILKQSNIVYRPWGYYNILMESANYKVKQILVYPNHRLSLQKHQHRSEHWTCVLGQITVVNNDETTQLNPNESIYINKGNLHRIENNGTENAEIIEVQCGDYLGEDDIVRVESDY